MISNYMIGFIRTYAGIAVGAVLGWVAVHWNIIVDDNVKAAAITGTIAITQALYYALARLLEHYVPAAGVLLGVPAKPTYPQVDASVKPPSS